MSRLAAVAVGVAGAIALTACGGGGGDSGNPTPAATYTIGVTVSGLSGSGLTLSDNSTDNLAIMLADGARQHLEQLAQTLPPAIVDRTQVEIGVPWRAVCDTAAADQCDLIVVGSHGYGGIDRLVGTTAAKIVNHAHCSVLVARTPV